MLLIRNTGHLILRKLVLNFRVPRIQQKSRIRGTLPNLDYFYAFPIINFLIA
jgi:hypothetical protein